MHKIQKHKLKKASDVQSGVTKSKALHTRYLCDGAYSRAVFSFPITPDGTFNSMLFSVITSSGRRSSKEIDE